MTYWQHRTSEQQLKFLLRHYDSPNLYCSKTKAELEKGLAEVQTHLFFMESMGIVDEAS
jgi:hypothetical protein